MFNTSFVLNYAQRVENAASQNWNLINLIEQHIEKLRFNKQDWDRDKEMMMITVYFSYHMKPKPKARIAKSVSIVSPMNNIRS